MAWNPNQQRKFVARKNKFALDENYHLDKIRGEHKEKKKLTLNVWTTLAISLILLLTAFAVPRVAQAVITRSHTDALVDLDKTRQSMLQAQMDNTADDTIFVIKEAGKYYLFFSKSGANILSKEDGKDTEMYEGIVEISNPKEYRPPVNVEQDKHIQYPFTKNPIAEKDGTVQTMEGLAVLSGYKLSEYPVNDELEKLLKKNVSIYKLVPVNNDAE